MLTYLFTDTDALSPEFIDDCLTWFPEDQVRYVRPAKALHDRRDRAASYLLLLRALEVWQSGIHDLPFQLVDWATLRDTAARYREGGKEHSVGFVYGPHGKPSIAGHPELHFNISHCKRAIALVFHGSSVGVDVECRRKVSDLLIRKACNPEEQHLIQSAADPSMEFLRLWTCKESYTKFTGTGLTVDIPSILPSIPSDVIQTTTALDFIDGWLTITQHK